MAPNAEQNILLTKNKQGGFWANKKKRIRDNHTDLPLPPNPLRPAAQEVEGGAGKGREGRKLKHSLGRDSLRRI